MTEHGADDDGVPDDRLGKPDGDAPEDPGDGTAGDDASEGPSRMQRAVPIVLGVAAFLVAAGATAWVLLGGDEAEETYTVDTRRAFLEACAGDGGDDARQVCECFYDSITETVAYERFDEVNRELLADLEAEPDGGVELPSDFEPLLEQCRRQVGSEQVATTTTTTP